MDDGWMRGSDERRRERKRGYFIEEKEEKEEMEEMEGMDQGGNGSEEILVS